MVYDLLSHLPDEIITKLKNTYQSPLHHAEGSVFVHSLLVSSKLPDEVHYQICALFHDMGKIDCTKFEEYNKGGVKISSIGHENYIKKYIENYSIYFSQFEIDWHKVEYICKQHMKAHLYLDGTMSNTQKRKKFEQQPFFEETIKFAKADNEGRMIENGQPIIVVTIGAPGSGKTTWRKKFIEKSDYVSVCPDEIREKLTGSISDQSKNGEVWKRAYKELDDYINKHQNVIFDSTGSSIKTIKEIEEHCKDKAIVCYKIFDVPVEVCKERIKNDISNNINRSNVPDEIVEKIHKNCENVVQFIKESKYFILT
jgi:predicted kinase